MAIDLAKRGSYNKETKEWVQSEGHTACVALLEEAVNKVRRGQPPTSYDPPHTYSPTLPSSQYTSHSYPTARLPTYSPTHHLHQAYEEACASATESTPAVEEALRFYAEYGDEARLEVLLDRGIVDVMATDKVGGRVSE